jgi:hypothetical protein
MEWLMCEGISQQFRNRPGELVPISEKGLQTPLEHSWRAPESLFKSGIRCTLHLKL